MSALCQRPTLLRESHPSSREYRVGDDCSCFFFQAEDGIRDLTVTGVQTCALPIFTRSRIKASRRARTVSFGSPEKMWPARGGRRIVSTLATIVGEFSNPTFFGSMPTSAHDQCAMTPPRLTRILPVKVGERGLLHPKFTVHRDGIAVCHHSVPSSAVRRARTVPSTMRTSETYVIWGRSRWPAIPGPT